MEDADLIYRNAFSVIKMFSNGKNSEDVLRRSLEASLMYSFQEDEELNNLEEVIGADSYDKYINYQIDLRNGNYEGFYEVENIPEGPSSLKELAESKGAKITSKEEKELADTIIAYRFAREEFTTEKFIGWMKSSGFYVDESKLGKK